VIPTLMTPGDDAAAAAPHIEAMSPSATPSACPICGKPQTDAYRPFCSKRCADVDLGRWLSGAYVVPSRDEEAEDELPAPPADDEDD
jgi:uncharacterized protein